MIARLVRVCRILLLLIVALPAYAREPLRLEKAPELYQRVLSLPGAALSPTAGAPASGTGLPVFSVLYVYERKAVGGRNWLEVGGKANGRSDGWIEAGFAEDWQTMLVMQYAPVSEKRQRVLMFENKQTLLDLLHADDEARRAQGYLSGLQSGRPDPAIIAAEPTEAVDTKQQLYVMPVLDSALDEFPDGTSTRLLQIASIPKQRPPPARLQQHEPQVIQQPTKPDLRNLTTAVVFVLDTTLSMGPYIERARQAIATLYQRLQADGTVDRVRFGLVAYRNNMDRNPRIEYVTKIYQTLDPGAPPDEILQHIQDPQECQVPTPGWDEDAFAGLYTALTQLNWNPFAARFLVLVTDSGGLPGKSRLAHYHDVDIDNIIELANEKHVAALPIHLLTREGDTHGDRSIALRQWHALGSRTGDHTTDKYLGIRTGSVTVYQQQLDNFGQQLAASINQIAHNIPLAAPNQYDKPTADSNPSRVGAADANQSAPIAQIVVNELFRAQAEYLGHQEKTQAPAVFRAWATDHDLLQPSVTALDVRVFLTRSQLNILAQNLNSIVEEVKRAAVAPESFFDNLQLLSATMSGNPDRSFNGTNFNKLGDSNLLPSWLKVLPYKSKILRMSRSVWLDLGITGQQEFIDELEYKLKQYQDMYANNARWTSLDPHDPADAVYPVPLESLP
jgi:serine/threonine-protein kinase PpkA